MARIPDQTEYRRRWRQLDTGTRRRIVAAVRRGETLDDPREAAMAVVAARGQVRFWSRAWLTAPVVSTAMLLLPSQRSLAVWAANTGLGLLVLGAMSWFSLRKAHRAEAGNLERAAGRRRGGAGKAGTGAQPASTDTGHTPRSRRRR